MKKQAFGIGPAELAAQYDVCVRTIRRWLLKHEHALEKRTGRYWTPKQLNDIYRKLGPPGNYSDKDDH